MKKILAILMVVALCLVLGAWRSPDAYERYAAAYNQMEQATSVEMRVSGSMKMTQGDTTTEVYMRGTVQQAMKDGDLQLCMNLKMELLGETIDTVSYYKDGYLYMSMMGLNYKMAFDVEEMSQQTSLSELDLIRDSTITSTIDTDNPKGTVLYFELDPTLMNTYAAGLMDPTQDLSGMDISYMNYTLLLDKDDNIQSYGIQMGINGGFFGMNMDYDLTYEVVSIDEFVAIRYPDNLDTFMEL